MSNKKSIDESYLSLVKEIYDNGIHSKDRTSVGSNKKLFGRSLAWDSKTASDGVELVSAPFIQCRKFAPRIAFEELMWMIRGQTDANILKEKNIHIWDGNTTREFLDSRGLYHLPEGSIGKGYGHQLRNFGGVDQLANVFNSLRDNPTDRRHVISLWNPPELDEAALPPCHLLYTFCVTGDNTLNLHQHMRSWDIPFGAPYNMGFASFFLALFAKALSMEAGELFFTGTDVHIYTNQMEMVEQMLSYSSNGMNTNHTTVPKFKINKTLSCLDDVLSVEWNDIELFDFEIGPEFDKPEMAQ